MTPHGIGDDEDVRAAAIEAARRGWSVFPTRPGGKEPRPGLSWPRAACNDPRRLMQARWRPGENYGIAAKPSGLVIIDLDMPKPGYELPPEWRAEPGVADGEDVYTVLAERAGIRGWTDAYGTYTVATPSGGKHMYFLAPPGRRIGNKPLGPLADVRGGGDGDGGYVLGPGSILDGRKYEVITDLDPAPLPDWVAALLDPPRRDSYPAASVSHAVSGSRYGRLRGLVQTVLDSTPGNRNAPLFWAACRAAEMVSIGEIDRDTAERVLVDAALTAGLRGGEHEARRTIASGFRQGATT
jgi:hypothetical protein